MTQILRLEKFAEVGAGNSAPQNEELFKGGSLPFIRTSDVGAIHIGSIETSRDLLTPEGAKRLKLQPPGTILFPKSGASTFLNHRVILNKPAYVSSHLATIKANNDLALDFYLFHFLQTINAQDLCQDQAYPSLNRDQIAGIEVPLPNLEKQREIVEKLDTAFAEIDLVEENLRLSDEKVNQLLQSILSSSLNLSVIDSELSNPPANQKVDFKLVKLSEVCLFNPPKSEARRTLNSDDLVSFMPMQDLGIQSINAEASSSKPLSEVIKAYTYFAENDVLVAKITPCFENGKMGIARNLVNGIGFGSSEYFVLRSTNSILSEYLYYFLRQGFVIDNGRDIMTGAVGHRRVPGEYFESLEILLPSLEKQQEIVRKLDSAFAEIEILKAQINIKRDYTTALRQSLLNSAFTQEEAFA